MKLIKHGPTGALTITADRTEGGVRLKLRFFVPTQRAWTMLACFCGKGRSRLKDRAGKLVPAIEQRLEPLSENNEMTVFSDQLRWNSLAALTQWQTEILIPENHVKRMKYLTIYLGAPTIEAQEKWHLLPETILLEAAEADWALAGRSAHFVLMSRGDATERLKQLYQTEQLLQSHRDEVSDALFDIFFLLIGGKDIQLMTCDLEDLTNDE